MWILAVDLASKFSAACVMTPSGHVHDEWHSWGRSSADWIESLTGWTDTILVVEDIPHGLKLSKIVRDVYRLQGKIIYGLEANGGTESLVWIPPKLWQDYYKPDGMKSGDKKAAKSIAAEKYGYNPPELLHKDLHGIDRVHARKTMEDHVDAFLIAQYVREQAEAYGSVDAAIEAIPRLERYASP